MLLKSKKFKKIKKCLPSFFGLLTSFFFCFVAGFKYLVISIAVISDGKLNRSLGVGLFVVAAVVLISAFVIISLTSSVFAGSVGSFLIRGGLVGLGAFGSTEKKAKI